MTTKALNKKGELTAAFHRSMDAFLNELLQAHSSGKMTQQEALGWAAHVIALMHNEGALSVASFFDPVLDQHPNIKWKG
ncbi:MAG TPA: hypothetical protein VHY32_05575 [Caulobacteraceae bacterium]|jgi:hypothetical protein|nr:hypothetical protein [Caulobacteraceae bacterium]